MGLLIVTCGYVTQCFFMRFCARGDYAAASYYWSIRKELTVSDVLPQVHLLLIALFCSFFGLCWSRRIGVDTGIDTTSTGIETVTIEIDSPIWESLSKDW